MYYFLPLEWHYNDPAGEKKVYPINQKKKKSPEQLLATLNKSFFWPHGCESDHPGKRKYFLTGVGGM
jgi:hypothetical protein